MKIVIFKSSGQWYFHVIARNNRIVCASEGYKRKGGALKTISKLFNATLPIELK